MESLEELVGLLARLPGLGPRSARRVALRLVTRRDTLLVPLIEALEHVRARVVVCPQCGNLDVCAPCGVCGGDRDPSLICVVESVGDLWALERAGVFRGRYHVLGGVLNAIGGVGPEALDVEGLVRRARGEEVREVVLATNATVDGQATAHFLAACLEGCGVAVSRLARGLPVGGELDYMDEATLSAAVRRRLPLAS